MVVQHWHGSIPALIFHHPSFIELTGISLWRPSPPSDFPSSLFLHSFPFICSSLMFLVLQIVLLFLLCFRRSILTLSFSFPSSFCFFSCLSSLFCSFLFSLSYPLSVLQLLTLFSLHITSVFRFKSPLPVFHLLIHFNLLSFFLHLYYNVTMSSPYRSTHNPQAFFATWYCKQNWWCSSISTVSNHRLCHHGTLSSNHCTIAFPI